MPCIIGMPAFYKFFTGSFVAKILNFYGFLGQIWPWPWLLPYDLDLLGQLFWTTNLVLKWLISGGMVFLGARNMFPYLIWDALVQCQVITRILYLQDLAPPCALFSAIIYYSFNYCIKLRNSLKISDHLVETPMEWIFLDLYAFCGCNVIL